MTEQLFFEKIKKHKGIYFTEYLPPSGTMMFATLSLIFIKDTEVSIVADAMDSELIYWLKQYPIPLMVTAFDKYENVIAIDDANEKYQLVGWLTPTSNDIIRSWKLDDLTVHLNSNIKTPDWRVVYADIPYRTHSEIKEKAAESTSDMRRRNFALKIILLLWVVFIPACWAIFEFLGPQWVGFLILAYTLWKIFKVWQKLTGITPPSENEQKKSDKDRKMAHYFYHCERNPAAFLKLKIQNFEADAHKQVLQDAQSILDTNK